MIQESKGNRSLQFLLEKDNSLQSVSEAACCVPKADAVFSVLAFKSDVARSAHMSDTAACSLDLHWYLLAAFDRSIADISYHFIVL